MTKASPGLLGREDTLQEEEAQFKIDKVILDMAQKILAIVFSSAIRYHPFRDCFASPHSAQLCCFFL
jgi:hypothetical protein